MTSPNAPLRLAPVADRHYTRFDWPMTRFAPSQVSSPSVRTGALVRAGSRALRDLAALTKPRITLMVLLTAAGGMWLAPVAVSPGNMFTALLAIALVVSAANSLNCYVERDLDGLMRRTSSRPLPAGRMRPRRAFLFSLALVSCAALALSWLVNPATFALGAVSLFLYVAIYTPLKQHSPLALFVGAIPGAMPPLMGWTAATGRLDWPGIALFGVLFLWQIPHFLAIATFRAREYLGAGHQVLPAVYGRRASHTHAVVWTIMLVAVTLTLEPLGVVSRSYTWAAALLGAAFLGVTVLELRPSRGDTGARRVFWASLVYLPLWLVCVAATAS